MTTTELQSLIAAGKTNIAIANLLVLSKVEANLLDNGTVILLSNRYEKIKKDRLNGFISLAEENSQLLQLNAALLEIIKDCDLDKVLQNSNQKFGKIKSGNFSNLSKEEQEVSWNFNILAICRYEFIVDNLINIIEIGKGYKGLSVNGKQIEERKNSGFFFSLKKRWYEFSVIGKNMKFQCKLTITHGPASQGTIISFHCEGYQVFRGSLFEIAKILGGDSRNSNNI